jgi:hypothetical protein
VSKQRLVATPSHTNAESAGKEHAVTERAKSWLASSVSHARTCEDSFSELRYSGQSAPSDASVEQWFALQVRLQRRTDLLLEKIALVKQGCNSIVEQLDL